MHVYHCSCPGYVRGTLTVSVNDLISSKMILCTVVPGCIVAIEKEDDSLSDGRVMKIMDAASSRCRYIPKGSGCTSGSHQKASIDV